MAEIHLPTKATQDSIKTETDKIQSVRNDTQFIKNQFPISGGTDFSDGIPKFLGAVTTNSVGVTAVSVQGSGILVAISNTNSGANFISIDIDGRKIVPDSGTSVTLQGLSTLVFLYGFKESLAVKCSSLSGLNCVYFLT